jgi:hypothetical protein
MTPAAIEEFAAQMREAALKVSVQIGYRPASSNMLSLMGRGAAARTEPPRG